MKLRPRVMPITTKSNEIATPSSDDGFEYISITREQAETLWRDADVMWLGLVSGMHHKVVRPLDLDSSSYLYLRVRSDG